MPDIIVHGNDDLMARRRDDDAQDDLAEQASATRPDGGGSDIDVAVSRSRKLEQMLEEQFGAEGKGLHQKLSSVADRLPETLVRKIRLVATVRNRVVHEDEVMDDRDGFLESADEAEAGLRALHRKPKRAAGAAGPGTGPRSAKRSSAVPRGKPVTSVSTDASPAGHGMPFLFKLVLVLVCLTVLVAWAKQHFLQ